MLRVARLASLQRGCKFNLYGFVFFLCPALKLLFSRYFWFVCLFFDIRDCFLMLRVEYGSLFPLLGLKSFIEIIQMLLKL